MVQAFKLVLKTSKYETCYGDGPDMQTVKDMVSDYGLTDSIVFAGIVSNMDEVLKYSRMFV